MHKTFMESFVEVINTENKKQLKEDFGVTAFVLTALVGAALGSIATNKIKNYLTKYKRCNSIKSDDIRFKCEAEILKKHIEYLEENLPKCKKYYSDDPEKASECTEQIKNKIMQLEKKKNKYKSKARRSKLDKYDDEDED